MTTPVRWRRMLLALGWTAFLLIFLLQQPGTPSVEIVAPESAPTWQREIAFTIGHLTGFGVLYVLWHRALTLYAHPVRAFLLAAVISFGVGLLAEVLQSQIPDRNASAYDIAVNTIGILSAAGLRRVLMDNRSGAAGANEDESRNHAEQSGTG